MARPRQPQRLDDIVDAARRVFMANGYRLTRMDAVAKEAGVSAGLLYSYAEGKEALYQLVLQRALGVALSDGSLPVPKPSNETIDALVRKAMRQLGSTPALDTAMKTDRPVDVRAELEAIIGEQYDQLHRHRHFVRLIERSARDEPALAERFYVRGRKPHVRRLAAYISKRVDSGVFATVPDADVAARFVVETIAWFANHRFGDYDGRAIDDNIARATVVQLTSAGLIGRQ